MKESKDHIDKIFHDKLGNQSFEIPADFIDSINQELDKMEKSKNENKGLIFLFFLNGIFITLLLSSIFYPVQLHQSIKGRCLNIQSSKIETFKGDPDNIILINRKSDHQNFSTSKESNSQTKKNYRSSKFNEIKNEINKINKRQLTNQKNDEQRDAINNFISPPDSLNNSDTLVIHDTITITDTITVTDTVVIQQLPELINPSKIKFENQLFIGSNFGVNKISNPNNDLTVKNIVSPVFGFNINAEWKNISFGSGIEYFQIGEFIELNTNAIKQTDSIEIVDYLFDTIVFDSTTQTNDTLYIPIYDTTTYSDTVYNSQNWVNTYSWLSIPLNIGYKFEYGKWSLIPKAGLAFNFGLRNADGSYYILDQNEYQIKELKPVQFNLDYLLQLEIRRKIKQTQLYFSPFYRGNISPMINNASTSPYNSFGLKLGIILSF